MADNFISQTFEEITDKTKDFLGIKRPELESPKITDVDGLLLRKLNLRIKEAEFLQKPKLQEWDWQKKFFEGKHWLISRVQIPAYKADTVINKFFAAVRSLVAFETDSKPDPEVEARIDPLEKGADQIREGAKKVRDALSYRWDSKNIPGILTEIYYDRYIYNDGFGIYFWNAVEDDVDFEQLKPTEILRSPGSTCIDDAEYVIVQKYRTKSWVENHFPDKVDEVKFDNIAKILHIEEQEKSERNNLALIQHYFEDEIWITKAGNVILEKKKNPFWEDRTSEEQEAEVKEKFGGFLPTGWQPIKNHLLKPEKPIVHFKGYHLGGDFYSQSLVKQVLPLALAVNKRKCQIQDNADGVGNGQWVIDPSVPEDVARKITSQPGLKIKINPTLIRKEQGMPLPQFVFEDLVHSEKAFDDMMGHHEISRGAVARKRMTKTETLALKEADITPVRLLMRNSEEAISRLLNGWTQLMKMYYDQPHFIKRNLNEGGGGFILNRNEIPDNLAILVRGGSTMPVSKEMRRAEYQALFAKGFLDPLTFFKLMDYPNPEKMAYRFVNWTKFGILSDNPPPVPQQIPMQTPTEHPVI